MIDFRIERSWSRDGYNVWIIDARPDGSFIWKPIQVELEKINEMEMLPEPTLRIDGSHGREILTAAQKAFAGLHWFNKEELDFSSKLQKAMQDHIESLKLVVDRVVKP